jgi:hypothetical protein
VFTGWDSTASARAARVVNVQSEWMAGSLAHRFPAV